MSGGLACSCAERDKPVAAREWRVYQRRCNHSAFNGYHRTPSDYSTVGCETCGRFWRTRSGYVAELRDRD